MIIIQDFIGSENYTLSQFFVGRMGGKQDRKGLKNVCQVFGRRID